MRASHRVAAIALLSAGVAAAAEAQTALGFPSFASGSSNLSVAAQFTDGATGFGGQLNFGRATGGLFAGVTGAWVSYDDIDESSLAIGGILGLGQRTAGGIEWAPFAQGAYITGPNTTVLGIDFDVSALQLGGGLGVGRALASSGSFSLVPFGTAQFAWVNTTVDVDGDSESESDTALIFEGGLGFRFANGMQITPSVSFSTFEDADPVFGARVSFPFGRK
jgi:hypothetical protein